MLYESVIIKYALLIYNRLYYFYKNSYTSRILDSLGRELDLIVRTSIITKIFFKKSKLDEVWYESKLCRLFEWILNIPVFIFRKINDFLGEFAEESVIIKFFKRLVIRTEIITGIFLGIMIVIPHNYWNNVYNIAIMVLLLFFLYSRASSNIQNRLDIKGFDPVLIMFILSTFMAFITAVSIANGFRFLVFHISGFLMVLIITNLFKNEKSLTRFIQFFIIAVSIAGMYGVAQFIIGVPMDIAQTDINLNEGMPGRIFSTMHNANSFGALLILSLPFFYSTIRNSKTLIQKAFFLALALPPLLSLVFTGSRSAWIAFIGSVLVIVFFTNRKLIPVFILLGLLSFPYLPEFVQRRVYTIFNSTDSSTSYRLLIYKNVIPVIKDFWVTGVGLGSDNFVAVMQNYGRIINLEYIDFFEQLNIVQYIGDAEIMGSMPAHSHNLYFEILIEKGILGLATIIWFVVRTFKKIMLVISDFKNSAIGNILLSGMASISAFLVMGLAEHMWFYPRIIVFFWAVVGIVLAGLAIHKQKEQSA